MKTVKITEILDYYDGILNQSQGERCRGIG